MLRKLVLSLMFIIGVAIAIPDVPVFSSVVGVQNAEAQTKRKRKTLFDLFKTRRKRKKGKRLRRANIFTDREGLQIFRQKRKKQRLNAAIPQNTQPVAPKVVKTEDAGKVLVIGDFMAGALAKGMTRRLSENAYTVVVNETVASSGIVREDQRDWTGGLPELIAEHKPVAVVVLLGMNDRQQFRLDTGRLEKLTPEWLALYNSRVEALANVIRDNNIPGVWVGLPPVRSNAMNTDYLILNEIFRSKAEAAQLNYVDVWDGFTNAEGKFVNAGPDVNGQIVRLRGSKGISMTRAGREKLAFFAGSILRQRGIIQDASSALYASLGIGNSRGVRSNVPDYDPVKSRKTVVISLGAPEADGGDVLEGNDGFLKEKSLEKSNNYKLVTNGLALKPQAGRIDSNWGTVEAEKAPKKDDKAVATSDSQTSTN